MGITCELNAGTDIVFLRSKLNRSHVDSCATAGAAQKVKTVAEIVVKTFIFKRWLLQQTGSRHCRTDVQQNPPVCRIQPVDQWLDPAASGF